MFSEDVCLGSTCGLDKLRYLNDTLNAKVIEEINESQGLLMLTNFAREANEYQFKKCLQDRISEVASWRWVLDDLSQRLEGAVESLKYEHNALRVVLQRIRDEMDHNCREALRPGAICPLTDVVENAIMQEFKFLRIKKNEFEKLILELNKQISVIEKTKKTITNDVLNKLQTLSIDEQCSNKNYKDANFEDWNNKRKKGFTLAFWVKRCAALKRAGLKALCNAMTTRQQVRGARVQLSISAQAYAARIEGFLKRRLFANKIKIQDLKWQREEAIRDYTSLEEELTSAENTLIIIIDQQRLVEARLNDRMQRPNRELIKDDVNRKLRAEQSQLRNFVKELQNNVERIVRLQNQLTESITHIDCCAEDLVQVINLDDERIQNRLGSQQKDSSTINSMPSMEVNSQEQGPVSQLTVIPEEDEDEYPFNY